VIANDLTVMQLQKQAVMHARAGADIVAPSGTIRQDPTTSLSPVLLLSGLLWSVVLCFNALYSIIHVKRSALIMQVILCAVCVALFCSVLFCSAAQT
jgi:hypothetical protein